MSVICLQIGLDCNHLTPEWKRDKAFQCLNVKRIRLRFPNSFIHFGHFDIYTSLTIVGIFYVFVTYSLDWKSYKFCQFWIIELSDGNIYLLEFRCANCFRTDPSFYTFLWKTITYLKWGEQQNKASARTSLTTISPPTTLPPCWRELWFVVMGGLRRLPIMLSVKTSLRSVS